jgi:hypothetical protein
MGLFNKLLGKITEEQFAQLAIRKLQEMGESRPVVFDPNAFALHVGDREFTIFLGNAYRDYQTANRQDREQILQACLSLSAAGAPAMPETLDETLPHLLPVLKARSGLEYLNLQARVQRDAQFSSIPYRPITEYLALALCCDTANAIMYISQSHLDEWHVTYDDLIGKAKENLQALPTRNFGSPMPGVFISNYQDTYDATRLVLPDTLSQLPISGTPVVVVPERNYLIVTGSEDVQGLCYVANICEKALETSRFISARPLVPAGEGWVEYHLAPAHAAYKKFKYCITREIAQEYMDQKQLLQQLYAATGEDIDAGKFLVFESVQKGLFSCAMWMKGVTSLLPVTDYVAFLDTPENALGQMPWEEAISKLGDLMKPEPELYPVRYRVSSFPSTEQLGQLQPGP